MMRVARREDFLYSGFRAGVNLFFAFF